MFLLMYKNILNVFYSKIYVLTSMVQSVYHSYKLVLGKGSVLSAIRLTIISHAPSFYTKPIFGFNVYYWFWLVSWQRHWLVMELIVVGFTPC